MSRDQIVSLSAALDVKIPKKSLHLLERGLSLLVDDIVEASAELDLKQALARLRNTRAKAMRIAKLTQELESLVGARSMDAQEAIKNRIFFDAVRWTKGVSHNAHWSFDVNLDTLITLCDKGLSVSSRKPVDLLLITLFWFVFEAASAAGLPLEIPSNVSKGDDGAPSRSQVYRLALASLSVLTQIAEVAVARSKLTTDQAAKARRRIALYRSIQKDSLIDRLRQARELQETSDMDSFAYELEVGEYRGARSGSTQGRLGTQTKTG